MSTPSSDDADAPYTTLAGPGDAEMRVERSRFVARAEPAPTDARARTLVAALARRHHDARHVCWAWRGGAGGTVAARDAPPVRAATQELRHDAGEPAGTAGEPILAALRHAELHEAVVVVVRWFGGVKLGPGGLSRAYGAAAAAALAAAPRRVIVPGAEHMLRFAYARENSVARVLERHGGRVTERQFGPEITWRIWLPNAARAMFSAELSDATSGAVLWDPTPPEPA